MTTLHGLVHTRGLFSDGATDPGWADGTVEESGWSLGLHHGSVGADGARCPVE